MEQYYKHRNFYLGAFLISKGYEMVSHNKQNGLTTFVFINCDKLQNDVKNYYSMKGIIDALSYSSAIRSLKSVIHSSDTHTNPKGKINNGNVKQLQGSL